MNPLGPFPWTTQSSTPRVRVCEGCGKQEGPDAKLRGCAACSASFYCGKACQKAAWKQHKIACDLMAEQRTTMHTMNGVVRPAQFSSGRAFSQAVADFLHAGHYRAFVTIVKAHVLLEGGIDKLTDPPRMMEFVLSISPMPKAARDPANGFSIVSHKLSPINNYMRIQLLSVPQQLAGGMPQSNVIPSMIPAMFSIHDLPGGTYDKIAKYGCRTWMNHPMIDNKPALREVIAFCEASINGGWPLRRIHFADDLSVATLPGEFMRIQGEWVWRPYWDDWDVYLKEGGGHPGIDQALAKLSHITLQALVEFIDEDR